jgi:hypothetical protein
VVCRCKIALNTNIGTKIADHKGPAWDELEKLGLNGSPGETLADGLPCATLKKYLAATELADLPDAHDREESADASVVTKKHEIDKLETSRQAQLKSNDIRHKSGRRARDHSRKMAPKFYEPLGDCTNWKDLLADLRDVDEKDAALLRGYEDSTLRRWLSDIVPDFFKKPGRPKKQVSAK